MKHLTVFGGIFGSAILVIASIALIIGFSIRSAPADKKIFVYIIQIINVLIAVGALSVPAITVMNFVKPDNKLKKISARIVITIGLIASIFAIYTLVKGFSAQILIILIAALLVSISGLLQFTEES